jgi:hypothetical protein
VIRRLTGLRAPLALVATLLCGVAAAHAEPRLEYQLQAAYVSKFLRFVEWPAAVRPSAVYRVGVVGSAAFLEAMEAVDGYALGEARIELVRVGATPSLEELHVLVRGPEAPPALALLRAARERPILTVSEATDFNDSGGIIQFVVVEAAMRFQVNVAASEAVGIEVSSRLLRLAVKVLRGEDR